MAEGFAVAALAHDDPEGSRAVAGLPRESRDSATRVLAALSTQGRDARRAFLRRALSPAPPPSEPVALCSSPLAARARGLLAPHVDRALGRTWLHDAPRVRPGFVPDPKLVQWLLHQLARSQ